MLDLNFCTKRISEICEHFRISSLERQIDSICSMISREGVLDVAVLGRFKAGKSSFLNSLTQESILPVGVIPVTSVITRLKYGATRRVTVVYQNGLKRLVNISELSEFISEKENPNNKKWVAGVEIELPSLKPYEGLEFVDTPGLGSTFKHNTAVSLDWLPRVGVAIVAIGVDPPLSDQDLELIAQLLRFTPKTVILLTKADLLSENHLKEIMEFVKGQLYSRFSIEFPIYFYSTAPMYSHLQSSLKEKLLDPLVQSKTKEVQEVLIHKLGTLLDECINFLRIALEVSERSQAEREKLHQQILGEKLSLGFTQDELQMMIREWMGRTRPVYIQKLSNLEESLISQLSNELGEQFKTWNFNLYQFTRAYEDWLRSRFGQCIFEISTREKEFFYAPLKNVEKALTRSVESFQNRLTRNIEEFLGVQVTNMKFEIELQKPSAPDISTSRGFDSHLDLLWFLIPMTLFKRRVQNHFLDQIPFEVEKNLSRLASQWTERINETILDMGRQATCFISDQVETMENLLLNGTDQTELIRGILNEVEGYRQNSENAKSSY